jgi:hypothetical protein
MSILERTDLRARMVQGAAAAAVTSVFTVLGASVEVSHPVAARGTAVVCSALAGSLAGIVYFLTESLRVVGGWRKSLANVVTLLAFCAFAIGFVGLAAWIHIVS